MKKSMAVAAVMFVFAGALMAVDLNVPKIDQNKLNKNMETAKQKGEELNVQKVKAAQTVEKAADATETGGQVIQEKSAELGADKGKDSKLAAKVASGGAKTGKTVKSKSKVVKEKAGAVK